MFVLCLYKSAEKPKTRILSTYFEPCFRSSPVIRMRLKSLESGLNSRFPVFFILWITPKNVWTLYGLHFLGKTLLHDCHRLMAGEDLL